MNDARANILERIRAANQGAGSIVAAQAEWTRISRKYSAQNQFSKKEMIELLQDRLLDYDAKVWRTAASELTATLATTFMDAGVHKIGIAVGFDQSGLPGGFEYVLDNNLTALELNEIDAVLSRCTVAIAETGTLVFAEQCRAGSAGADPRPGHAYLHRPCFSGRSHGARGVCVARTHGDAADYFCLGAFRYRGYRDDPNQGCAWAALSPRSFGRRYRRNHEAALC